MKNTKIIIGIVVIALVVLGFWYSQKPKEAKNIKMSYIPASCDLVNFVAQEKGFYTEEGLNVELTKFDTSNQASDALIAGRIDASGCFAYPVAFSVEASQPDTFKSIRSIVASPDHPFLWLVAKTGDDSIKSFKDLAGKKVGRFPGSTTEAQLKYILKKVGVDPNSVTMQPIAQAQQINVLISGSVDALFVLEPTPTVAEVQGVGRKVENAETYFPNPRYNALYAVLKSYYRNNKDIVKRIEKAQDRAVDYIRQNPDEARKVLTKYTPYDESIVLQVDPGYALKSNEKVDLTKVQEYADILLGEGDLKSKIDVSKLFGD
ncbi:MAG: ABC transporter substrate-binding protein [Bacteroidia bacterium]|nr:ABC transporter substrate-binding protein [Bacteroidia bacterium]